MPAPTWISSLDRLLDESPVAAQPPVLQPITIQGVRPAHVVAPKDARQVAEVLRFAADSRIPVLPYGNGTGSGIGAPPPENALALSTRRMNLLIHHEPADMVATVQAGMELGAFQAALGERGQWLAIDGDPRATIGGLLATDRSGPRALGYGTFRDQVLGMAVVNGDGVVRKCGAKVVKNVTGYALEKLYIGSLGTLGVITEVTFKLRPLPIARDGWHIPAESLKDGLDLLRRIDAKNLPLEMLQLVSKSGHALNAELDLSAPFHVLISAAGARQELDRIDRELSASAGKPARRFECPTSTREFWLFNAPPETKSGKPSATLRFWCLRSTVQAAVDALLTGDTTKTSFVMGLTGGTVALASPTTESIGKLSDTLTKLGVNFRIENAADVAVEKPFGPARPEWALMRQIKGTLDPSGVLNPGRFVV